MVELQCGVLFSQCIRQWIKLGKRIIFAVPIRWWALMQMAKGAADRAVDDQLDKNHKFTQLRTPYTYSCAAPKSKARRAGKSAKKR